MLKSARVLLDTLILKQQYACVCARTQVLTRTARRVRVARQRFTELLIAATQTYAVLCEWTFFALSSPIFAFAIRDSLQSDVAPLT